MAKVTLPLLSGEARGQFGKAMIHRRGGVVTKYFSPRNPKSAAQTAQREAFRRHYVTGLTQAQADLLYAAIIHQHDDLYSLLGHVHHMSEIVYGNGLSATIPAGATRYMFPYYMGLGTNPSTIKYPFAAMFSNMEFRTGGTQSGTGSIVATLYDDGVPTSIVVTVPAGGFAGGYVDDVHTHNMAAGSVMHWQLVNNASVTSVPIAILTTRATRTLND